MKLYHFCRDWFIPGQQPKGASRVDIPNSPSELCAWLNHRRVPIAMPLPQPEPSLDDLYNITVEHPPVAPAPHSGHCPGCASKDPAALERGAQALAAGANANAIAERIMELNGFELGILASAVAERFKQLAASAS